MLLFRYVMMFVIPSLFLIFIACSSVHKLAGSEFMHVYLIMIYLFLLYNDVLPFKSFLQLLSYVDLPFLSFIVDYNNPNIDHKLLESAFTAIVYYLVVISVAFIYTVLRVCKKMIKSQLRYV